jgi:integrase
MAKKFNLLQCLLPDIRFHDLRHYHATVLYNNNVSDKYAAERLGHDIMVLKKIYQHLQESTKSKEDQKILEIFKKKTSL